MLTVILILLTLMAVLLIGVVLIQESKGGGISSAAFGGMGGQMGSMFGATRSADFIQKLTYWLMVGIGVVAIFANLTLIDHTGPTSDSTFDGLTPSAATQPIMDGGAAAPAPAETQTETPAAGEEGQ